MYTASVLRVAELWGHTTAGKMDDMTAHSARNHALHLHVCKCVLLDQACKPPGKSLVQCSVLGFIRRPWKITCQTSSISSCIS